MRRLIMVGLTLISMPALAQAVPNNPTPPVPLSLPHVNIGATANNNTVASGANTATTNVTVHSPVVGSVGLGASVSEGSSSGVITSFSVGFRTP